MRIEEKISILIKTEREKQGIPRRELAQKTGCTETAIWYWEAGKRTISLPMANEILKALGISITIGKEEPHD